MAAPAPAAPMKSIATGWAGCASAFNTGGLTKFKKLLGNLNKKNYTGSCDEFADITNGGGKGLKQRRKLEMKLFRNNVYDAEH